MSDGICMIVVGFMVVEGIEILESSCMIVVGGKLELRWEVISDESRVVPVGKLASDSKSGKD